MCQAQPVLGVGDTAGERDDTCPEERPLTTHGTNERNRTMSSRHGVGGDNQEDEKRGLKSLRG